MRLFPLLLLPLVGCNGSEKGDDDTSAEVVGPDIEVAPGSVAFGALAVGEGDVREIRVTNPGDEALEIHGVELEDSDLVEVYTISAIGAVLIAPGGGTTFSVTFEPDTIDAFETEILVDSNAGQVRIPLSGSGEAGLTVAAEPDFGTVYAGCRVTDVVTLANAGSDDLVVSDVAFDTVSVDFAFGADERFPWTLAPGASTQVWVTYAPTAEGADEGVLVVTSDDTLSSEVRLDYSGSAVSFGENLDTFAVGETHRADLVFVLDGSALMTEEVERFDTELLDLVDVLEDAAIDYQLAVVAADDGCVEGNQPFVDASVSRADRADLLSDMVNADFGTYTDAGFSVLESATTATNLGAGGCNEGMLRAGAELVVVGVTNGEEESPNPWSTYVNVFQGLVADPDDLVMHAIAPDYPSGCGSFDPGQGWYEASVATGGLFMSICEEDRAAQMEAIVAALGASAERFDLSAWPVEETLVVRVDGVAVTTGWTYAESDNAVVFDTAPAAGAVVEVAYTLLGDCEG